MSSQLFFLPSKNPTQPHTYFNLELSNSSVEEFYNVQKCQSTDNEGLKLWNVWSGEITYILYIQQLVGLGVGTTFETKGLWQGPREKKVSELKHCSMPEIKTIGK